MYEQQESLSFAGTVPDSVLGGGNQWYLEVCMSKQTEALKLALEALNRNDYLGWQTNIHVREAIREALADSALDRMAENARDLGLDYEPPCKTGSQCTNKCQQCEHPAQQEPHGWYIDGYGAVLGASEPKSVRPGEWLPFYTSPQPAQPSKPLVGLTDEQKDAARYRWLKARLIGADFDWNESGACALVFEWPKDVSVSVDCDQNIDAAIEAANGIKGDA